MASEPKTEPKPETKEPATVVSVAEENSEPPLKYKTLVLKVSVHCEGCKKKVIKILKKMEGVYKVEIDLRQQKVSVIGNVDAQTLIKQLLKAGKHAELWPEIKADNKEKKKSKSKNKNKDKENKEKQSDHESEDDQEDKETGKTEDPSKTCENVKNAEPPAGTQSQVSVVDKKSGEESEGAVVDTTPGGGSGGGKKKKKKNKGHNGNNNNNNNHNVVEGEHSRGAPAGNGSVSQCYGPYGQGPMISPANHSPPRPTVYQHPVQYYAPPPVYAVNYNTAYPSTSYGASIYPPSYSYTYMHPGTMNAPPPYDSESYASRPSDSFEIFSDENPNACSVM